MSDRARRPVRALLGLAALLATALTGPAAFAGPYAAGSVGYRHSLGLDAGGLSLGAHLGVTFGRFGLEYGSIWSNDHTFKPVEERRVARNTNFFDLMVAPVSGEHVQLWIGVGPGLGWVRPPGKPVGPSRVMSAGLHEYLRLDLLLGDDVQLRYGLRVGAWHLWQGELVDGPEHALDVGLMVGFGF
jgi:hypothetical protein